MLIRTRDTSHELVAAGIALALAAAAWAVSANGSSPGSHLHTGSLFLAAWMLMTAAMMFPSTLPMLTTYARLVRSTNKVLLFICGYLAAWTACGVVALVADIALQRVTGPTGHSNLIGAGVLTLAAVYQFTPLKRHCLSKCRSALSFLMQAWRDGPIGACLMGMHHGVFCVGCCWALMLVMLALGMSQLTWMLALTLAMFAEKVVRGGEVIGRMIAPALFAGAVLMVGGNLA